VLSVLTVSGETLRGESKVGDLVGEEDEELQPSISDSVLLRRGLSSALQLPLGRRGLDRVPAAPITFIPIGSSIGSQLLSAQRMSTARIWSGRSRARLDQAKKSHQRMNRVNQRAENSLSIQLEVLLPGVANEEEA
jgi:hypothetical protein